MIAICEVKPKNTQQVFNYQIPNYTLHPINLDSKTGRGIAVFTHSFIEKSVIQIKSDLNFCECCLVEIKLKGGDLMLFGCFYRSPTLTDSSLYNAEQLNKILSLISRKKYSHTCLVGDFNFPDINWESWTTPHNEDSKEFKFIETLRDCFLHQHNLQNSRRRGNDEPSLVDLVLTDERMHISEILHQSPLGKSDHNVLTFDFNCYLDYKKQEERYNYPKADYQGMRTLLSDEKWSETFLESVETNNLNSSWNSFKSKLVDLKEKFVPKSTSSSQKWKQISGFPINREAKQAIKEKHSCHRKWMRSLNRGNHVEAKQAYRRATNKVKSLLHKSKRKFEQSIAKSSKSNPKPFWSLVRNKLKTKEGVAPLLTDPANKNSIRFEDKEKADILQKQFCSVFTREPQGPPPYFPPRTTETVSLLEVTEMMVTEEILALDVNKSSGSDGISPWMLKELAPYIAKPLTAIMKKSFETEDVPADWRNANVCAIYKKGLKNSAENYRPISLTSIVCKIMEKLVRTTLMDHLTKNDLISAKQFGFMSGRSTTTQLLNFPGEVIDEV